MGVNGSQRNDTASADSRRGRSHTSRTFATAMLALLSLIWGLTFPSTKAALANTDPMHFLAIRFALGYVLLVGYYALRDRRMGTRVVPSVEGTPPPAPAPGLHPFWARLRQGPLRTVRRRGVVVGLFLASGFVLQTVGMKYTTASRSGFFTGLLVVMVPPLALMMRTSRSPLSSWLALLPAVFGVWLLADPGRGGLSLGDWLTIGCALSFALQMIVLEGLAGERADARQLTLAQVAVVAAVAVAWSLFAGRPLVLNPVGWMAALYTAVFGTVVAVWLQTRFQPEVPAGHAALIFQLEPVFAAIFAWLLLGEGWTLRGLAGAAFILLAMTVSSLGMAHMERREKKKRAARG